MSVPIVQRLAAEFEPVEAVWLIWPPYDHKNGFSNSDVTLSMIKELISTVRVELTCSTSDLLNQAKIKIGEDLLAHPNLSISVIPSSEIWARDMGPNFVESQSGNHVIVDFAFDNWGYSEPSDPDTKCDKEYDVHIAKKFGLSVLESPIISEAGDRETNGKGLLITSEHVELGRNPHLTKSEIEEEFRRVLGIKKIIWLKKGLYEDDHTFLGKLPLGHGKSAYTVATTNGHVDEYVRFVNENTLVLAQIDPSDLNEPIALENHRRLEENYRILKNATDQDGNPLQIVRITLPTTLVDCLSPGDYTYEFMSELIYQDGTEFPHGETISVLAAGSYLNFLITDSLVLGQKYWAEGRDEKLKKRDADAKSVLESVFPDRKVVMLDAYAINLGGGGIHCISMQQPKMKTLKT